MASRERDFGSWIAVAALALVGSGPALAAPSIQAVYTDHSKGGTPISINIVGSGFTCPDCGPPKVALGGLSLTVKAHSAQVITAVLPQPLASGDYTLAVTTGPALRAEVARFSLSVAPVSAGRVVTNTVTRSSVSADVMPPPPNLLRGASTATTRSTGPLSRSGRGSGKTSVVAAADPVSTARTLPEATLDQVVSGLPAYNTAYGEYALFDLSRGYNSGTRGNSAFGYGALLKTTSGSYNNGFGFYALYNNVEGGYNSAFGNWALYSNTSGLNNSAFGHEALYSNTTGEANAAAGSGALRSNTTGTDNTASGFQALYSNTMGGANTASGAYALFSNTTGSYNTASGHVALYRNTTGRNNTAIGYSALLSNTTGIDNTASGVNALLSNTTGINNTAGGVKALYFNTTGSDNTANGHEALYGNTTGQGNTASGSQALYSNSTGYSNAASGVDALGNNTTGYYNTASGAGALLRNTTGFGNTASGAYALWDIRTGNNNTALGYTAGYSVITGSNNIHIGAGNTGSATDSGVIRLGRNSSQLRTFVAGIRGVTTGQNNAVAVLIDSDGQLGTVSSSRRKKEDIQPMDSMSERLFALRPVTFRYKKPYEDGSKPMQFGLIAEEVAEVFPELAVYGKDGQPETVSYHLLATLLLNELQKEHRVTGTLQEQVSVLKLQNEALVQKVAAQTVELSSLRQEVALLAKLVGGMEKGNVVASAR